MNELTTHQQIIYLLIGLLGILQLLSFALIFGIRNKIKEGAVHKSDDSLNGSLKKINNKLKNADAEQEKSRNKKYFRDDNDRGGKNAGSNRRRSKRSSGGSNRRSGQNNRNERGSRNDGNDGNDGNDRNNRNNRNDKNNRGSNNSADKSADKNESVNNRPEPRKDIAPKVTEPSSNTPDKKIEKNENIISHGRRTVVKRRIINEDEKPLKVASISKSQNEE
ncbi:MAG: hypothetical protein ACLFQK_09240 [Fibrobacterota bacterium]